MNLEVTLVSGTKLSPENIISTTVTHMGASRRALQFVFAEDAYSMDELKNLFTEANCETIVVADTGIPGVDVQETEHSGYVLPVSISTSSEIATPGDEEHEPTYKTCVKVMMAKRTYEENRLAALQKSTDQALLLALGVEA